MTEARDTLHVRVEYFTGFEEGDDEVGYPYYVAVTDGRTWNELMRNIHEMIATSLDEEDTAAVHNLIPNPRVVMWT